MCWPTVFVFSSALARRTRQPPCYMHLCQIQCHQTHMPHKPFLIWLVTTPTHLKCVAILTGNLSMACFLTLMFHKVVWQLLRNPSVENICKSVKTLQSYGHEFAASAHALLCRLQKYHDVVQWSRRRRSLCACAIDLSPLPRSYLPAAALPPPHGHLLACLDTSQLARHTWLQPAAMPYG